MAASKKRGRSMFDVVQKIETEDAVARTKRRATSVQRKAASKATLSQQAIYGKLLEVRILLQRALHADDQGAEKNDDDPDDEKKDSVDKCTELLTMLLEAREKLSNDGESSTNYKKVVGDAKAFEEILQSEYEQEEKSWKEVLNRRHKDVRLHAGLAAKSQFRVLDSTFWEQVESTVSHEKLLSQQKKKENGNNVDNAAGGGKIFDDSKIYQHFLKEFVSSHPASSRGSTSANGLRNNTRRTVNKVDRRASKGRKLRYTPIPKLANFTYPLSRPEAILDQDAWFQSLFGGAAQRKKKA